MEALWRSSFGGCQGRFHPVHPYKYRMVFVKSGRRIVGFDNERGKGDHRHLDEVESPYRFVDIQTLLADFWHEVDSRGDSP